MNANAARDLDPAPSMPAGPVSRQLATSIERCETEAWSDLYAAAPADFAATHGLALVREGDAVATLCKTIPFIHFNCVMNLGSDTPAEERQVDAMLAHYSRAGIKGPWFYHAPHFEPAGLPQWYAARGLRQRGGWDRIWRDAAPLPLGQFPAPAGAAVERVTRANAAEWAGFIDGMYGLPTSPWLLALVGRPGWSHYVLRQDGRTNAVRSLYLGRDGLAWSGIEAPVPGIMAPSFAADAAIVETMVRDALAAGARLIAADIEAPDARGEGPAYDNFARLGFRKAYFRQHYGV